MKLEETLAQFIKVSMSNHKSIEFAIKNLEVQVGQRAKQLVDRPLSYPNFVRGLLFDDMQPCFDCFEVLGTLCCTICEVPRHAGNQKEALLRNL